MSCRYELLVVDLDGTLLRRDGSVSLANCRALEEARQAGMEVIVATGRALVESRRALDVFGHDGLVVAAGGSLLCDSKTGQTLDRRVLDRYIVHEITGTLTAYGHKVLILKDSHATGYDYLAVGDGDLDPASEWWFSHLPVSVKHVSTLDEDEHPHDRFERERWLATRGFRRWRSECASKWATGVACSIGRRSQKPMRWARRRICLKCSPPT